MVRPWLTDRVMGLSIHEDGRQALAYFNAAPAWAYLFDEFC